MSLNNTITHIRYDWTVAGGVLGVALASVLVSLVPSGAVDALSSAGSGGRSGLVRIP
jgi:hypothetical protein